MPDFVHQRHKPPAGLERPRELGRRVRSPAQQHNLSRIVRVASCSGVSKVIACGTAKVIGKIARDGADTIEIEVHRTLPPVLRELKQQGYRLVGLEQATGSHDLHAFAFDARRRWWSATSDPALATDELRLLDDVVEIPVYGLALQLQRRHGGGHGPV